MVTRDYFTTLGLPILRGRNFDVSDREGSGRVVIVNVPLEESFFRTKIRSGACCSPSTSAASGLSVSSPTPPRRL